jgi:hypothetical protein
MLHLISKCSSGEWTLPFHRETYSRKVDSPKLPLLGSKGRVATPTHVRVAKFFSTVPASGIFQKTTIPVSFISDQPTNAFYGMIHNRQSQANGIKKSYLMPS